MTSQKSNDSNLNDSNAVLQRLNFFSQNNNSVQPIDSEPDVRILNTDSYPTPIVNVPPVHQDIRDMNQPNQSELDYYEEYRKIYLISYHLFLQKNKQVENKTILEKRIKSVEDKLRDLQKQQLPKRDSSEQNRIKRSRRTAEEIERKYRCQVEYCERSYGSQGSLQQHIKLKHPELYKQYEQKFQQGQYSVSQ